MKRRREMNWAEKRGGGEKRRRVEGKNPKEE